MTPEHPNLEAELRRLRATPLDEDFLLRLEACADGTLTQSSPEELRFEAKLRETRPAPLDPAFLASLEKVFAGVPFPVDEKILLFPKANNAIAAERPKRQRPMWAAAAAVALIGGFSALLMPAGNSTTKRYASTGGGAGPAVAAGTSSNIVPASFNRGVSEVNDEGIVWKGDNQPHNLVRVVYKDKMTVKENNGKTYQVEQPRVHYMLVPAHTD
jgi:hypothetical protein